MLIITYWRIIKKVVAINFALFVSRDLQFHNHINGIRGQSIQSIDFPVTPSILGICLGNFIQRIAPDNGVDSISYVFFCQYKKG